MVVPYEEKYQEAHRDFAAKMWPEKRRRRDDRYNRWKFRGPSSGPVDGLLLAVADGKVVGQLGLIPATLRIGVEEHRCQWACDLMVDTSARRQGVGSLLLATAMARDTITLGSNPSPAADVTMSRIGFKPLSGPRIMVLPLKLSHVLSWKMPEALSNTIPLLSALGQPLATMRCWPLARARKRDTVRSCRWEEVAPLIEARQSILKEPHIIHDLDFLKWRCSGLAGLSPELQAVRTPSGSYAIVGAAAPYFYVYDWSAQDADQFFALFHLIYKMAKKAKSETIQALAQNAREERWLKDARFLALRQRFKIICYPSDKLVPEHRNFYYSVYDSDGNL